MLLWNSSTDYESSTQRFKGPNGQEVLPDGAAATKMTEGHKANTGGIGLPGSLGGGTANEEQPCEG